MNCFSKRILPLVILTVMFLAPTQSARAFELGAFGGLSFDSSALSPANNTLSAKPALALGAAVGFDLVPLLLSVETGFVIAKRKQGGAVPIGITPSAGVDAASYRVTYTAYEIPLIARFKPIPILSPGVGVFYSWAGADETTSFETTGVSIETSTTSPVSRTDYGLIGSLQARFPLVPLLNLTIDGRYLLGLKENGYRGANTIKLRELQVLGGLTFAL